MALTLIGLLVKPTTAMRGYLRRVEKQLLRCSRSVPALSRPA